MTKESYVKKKNKEEEEEEEEEKEERVERAPWHLVKRYDDELTMARSLFRNMKRSGYLMRLRASMSFGRRRGCTKAIAT